MKILDFGGIEIDIISMDEFIASTIHLYIGILADEVVCPLEVMSLDETCDACNNETGEQLKGVSYVKKNRPSRSATKVLQRWNQRDRRAIA
jgi:hypothetical protein